LKAIKFLILGAGILGVISFFLPYFNLELDDQTIAPSGMDVMVGLEIAEKGASEVRKEIETATAVENKAELKKGLDQAEEFLDLVKGIIAIMFLPGLVLAVIGGVGAVRKQLGRVGGTFALFVGLICLATDVISMAALSDAEIQREGMSPGIALYLMMFVSTIGFVCGILTLIKPDQGGRFG